MKQPTASTSLLIKVVTGGVLALNAGLYIASLYHPAFPIAGILSSVIILGCYFFWTPVAYELNDGELTVSFRVGRVRYRPVVKCSMLDAPFGCGIRLWGNGGLFAGSGIFWSRKLGVFRAYVTRSKQTELVLVETNYRKIIISPEDPCAWLAAK